MTYCDDWDIDVTRTRALGPATSVGVLTLLAQRAGSERYRITPEDRSKTIAKPGSAPIAKPKPKAAPKEPASHPTPKKSTPTKANHQAVEGVSNTNPAKKPKGRAGSKPDAKPDPKPEVNPDPKLDANPKPTPDGAVDDAKKERARTDGKQLDKKVPPKQRSQRRLAQQEHQAQLSKAKTTTRKREIQQQYWSKHRTYVAKDDTVYAARYDAASGKVTYERRDEVDTRPAKKRTTAKAGAQRVEQPRSMTVTRKIEVDLDGSGTATTTVQGKLKHGSDESTETTNFNAKGVAKSSTRHHVRDTDEGGVSTRTEESATYDGKGEPTHAESTTTVDDRNAHRKTVTKTTDSFKHGVMTGRHATTEVTGQGPEPNTTLNAQSTTNATFDKAGRPTKMHASSTTTIAGTTPGTGTDNPTVEWSQTERTDTTLDGKGKPIYGKDGSPVVVPQTTLDRTQTTRTKDSGQDDGTDLVTETLSHARSNEKGDLVFDPFAKTTETSEGKDGAVIRRWDAPLDTATGATPENVPEDQRQRNVTTDDQRSGFRRFKDSATQFAGIGAAVLGTALLFTGVGTAAGAALLVGSAALGTFALGSTIADKATGRNHVNDTDIALAAVGAIPGVGAGAARIGARVASTASTLGKASKAALVLEKTAGAMDLAGKASTAGMVAFEGGVIADKVAKGQGVGTLDVLNLLAAAGGAKHAFGGPRLRTSAKATDTSTAVAGARGGPTIDVTTAKTDFSVERLQAVGRQHGVVAPANGKATIATKGAPGELVYTNDSSGTLRGYSRIGADGRAELVVRMEKDGSWTTERPTDGTWNPKTIERRAATADEIPGELPIDSVKALVGARSDQIRREAGSVDSVISDDQLAHVTRRHVPSFGALLTRFGLTPADGSVTVPRRDGTTKIEQAPRGGESSFADGTTGAQIREHVRTALEDGTWTRSSDDGFSVVHDTGKTIGTDQHGAPTNLLNVVVVNGKVVTTYPTGSDSFRAGLRRDSAAFADTPEVTPTKVDGSVQQPSRPGKSVARTIADVRNLFALNGAVRAGGTSLPAVMRTFSEGSTASFGTRLRSLIDAHQGGAIFVGDLPVAGESALAGAARAQGMRHVPVFDGTVDAARTRLAEASGGHLGEMRAVPGALALMKRGVTEPFETMTDTGTVTLNGKAFEYTPGDVLIAGDRIVDRAIFHETYGVVERDGKQFAYKTSPTLLREFPGNFGVLDDESRGAMLLTRGRPGDVLAEGVEHGERWRITHDAAHEKYPDLPGGS